MSVWVTCFVWFTVGCVGWLDFSVVFLFSFLCFPLL